MKYLPVFLLIEQGERTVVMDHNFFCGYRRTAVEADEVVLSVTIPYTSEVPYVLSRIHKAFSNVLCIVLLLNVLL